ncbi:MAG: methyltransferase domain-containing protein [Chitinivibrionales bacterium]|nr:methyltransferase domain-containing protein [Chitinivibrionales bacterium]
MHKNAENFRAEIEKVSHASSDDFFSWFNNSSNKDTAFNKGKLDFLVNIKKPLDEYIDLPADKVALDIGHGGGRLLAEAANHFGKTLGIDIHNKNNLVSKELKTRAIFNYQLIQFDGAHLPFTKNAIDIAYTFIVFQHLGRIELFKILIDEIFRILQYEGIAVIYFGRKRFFSLNKKSYAFFLLDCLFEQICIPNGFIEFAAPVNHSNLYITLPHAKKIARKAGFHILKTLVSRKINQDGEITIGGQHGIILSKQQIKAGHYD